MSYDRFYVEDDQQLGGFLESRCADNEGKQERFQKLTEGWTTTGFYVALSHGKNCAFDELFIFATLPAAKAFFDHRYSKWETFPNGEEEGNGFQEITLYAEGKLVARKEARPTIHIDNSPLPAWPSRTSANSETVDCEEDRLPFTFIS